MADSSRTELDLGLLMSAATAKTQEPTMEEILASIRRIIAEDQDIAKPEEEAAAPEEEARPAAAVEAEVEPSSILKDLPEPAEPEPAPAEPEPAPAQPEAAAAEPEPMEPAPVVVQPTLVNAEPEEVAAPPQPASPLADLEVAVPEVLFGDPPPRPEPAPAFRAERPAQSPYSERPFGQSQGLDSGLQDRIAAEALISSAAGASVGQAFNMLSHTVLTQNARTLEDLVREMLKPMLKVWLDDNLPPLVERLVRAEIERVARGRN